MKRKFNNITDLDAAIIFSTNVMNEQTENNKQTNCFLKIFIRKPISLPLEAIHVTLTGSSVKSAEHMAKINTKIKLILLVALGQDKQKLCIPLVGLAPVRLLRPSMAVSYHVNGKL